MGCYDSVTFRCPKCGTVITEQSKAGDCDLLVFPSAEVPLRIAVDLLGESLHCGGCDSHFYVRSQLSPYVELYLSAAENEAHDD